MCHFNTSHREFMYYFKIKKSVSVILINLGEVNVISKNKKKTLIYNDISNLF